MLARAAVRLGPGRLDFRGGGDRFWLLLLLFAPDLVLALLHHRGVLAFPIGRPSLKLHCWNREKLCQSAAASLVFLEVRIRHLLYSFNRFSAFAAGIFVDRHASFLAQLS